MKYTIDDQTMALAGIYQAAYLVQQMARQGQAPGATLESCLETLFKFDSQNVQDVFGGVAGISMGLKTLRQQLSGSLTKSDMEITRYVISLLHLEKKLRRNEKMLAQIAQGLEKTQNQMDYFSLTHENVLANLAGIYQDTISQLQPRIIVQGEQSYLSQQATANKIRALLLAGIRCAFLWQQTGGSRIKFLFFRKKYLQSAEALEKSI